MLLVSVKAAIQRSFLKFVFVLKILLNLHRRLHVPYTSYSIFCFWTVQMTNQITLLSVGKATDFKTGSQVFRKTAWKGNMQILYSEAYKCLYQLEKYGKEYCQYDLDKTSADCYFWLYQRTYLFYDKRKEPSKHPVLAVFWQNVWLTVQNTHFSVKFAVNFCFESEGKLCLSLLPTASFHSRIDKSDLAKNNSTCKRCRSGFGLDFDHDHNPVFRAGRSGWRQRSSRRGLALFWRLTGTHSEPTGFHKRPHHKKCRLDLSCDKRSTEPKTRDGPRHKVCANTLGAILTLAVALIVRQSFQSV